MARMIKIILSPIGFALLFLGPLFAEFITLTGLSLGAADPLWIGLIVALAWGSLATWRGSWLGIQP